MDHSEIRAIVREEIAKMTQIILFGSEGANTKHTSSIEQMLPGMPTQPERPIMQPFGLSSRAPRGTNQVTAKVGDHPANRMVLGHRDANKPDVDEGETKIYGAEGYCTKCANDGVQHGKDETLEYAVLGETLTAVLEELIDLIAQHTHASPGSPPTEAPLFTLIKNMKVSNDKLLVKEGNL